MKHRECPLQSNEYPSESPRGCSVLLFICEWCERSIGPKQNGDVFNSTNVTIATNVNDVVLESAYWTSLLAVFSDVIRSISVTVQSIDLVKQIRTISLAPFNTLINLLSSMT